MGTPAWFERVGQRTFVALGGVIGLLLSLLLVNYVAPARVVVASAPAATPPASEQATAIMGTQDAPVEPASSEGTVQTEQASPDVVTVPMPARGIQASQSAPLPASPVAETATAGDSSTPPGLGGFSAGGMVDKPSPSYSLPSPPSSDSYSGGGTVHVRGYYRKDGTYVRPHTRRSPRR